MDGSGERWPWPIRAALWAWRLALDLRDMGGGTTWRDAAAARCAVVEGRLARIESVARALAEAHNARHGILLDLSSPERRN